MRETAGALCYYSFYCCLLFLYILWGVKISWEKQKISALILFDVVCLLVGCFLVPWSGIWAKIFSLTCDKIIWDIRATHLAGSLDWYCQASSSILLFELFHPARSVSRPGEYALDVLCLTAMVRCFAHTWSRSVLPNMITSAGLSLIRRVLLP